MTRLIDADELKLSFCKECTLYPDKCLEETGYGCDWHAIWHINMMQTIDAVPVVRCKDCIHRYVTGDVTQYYVCDFMDAQYKDDGYCHHGERVKE